MCLWRRASSITGTENENIIQGWGKKNQINIKLCVNGGTTALLRSFVIIWAMSSVYRLEPKCSHWRPGCCFFLFVGYKMSTFILTQNNLKESGGKCFSSTLFSHNSTTATSCEGPWLDRRLDTRSWPTFTTGRWNAAAVSRQLVNTKQGHVIVETLIRCHETITAKIFSVAERRDKNLYGIAGTRQLTQRQFNLIAIFPKSPCNSAHPFAFPWNMFKLQCNMLDYWWKQCVLSFQKI